MRLFAKASLGIVIVALTTMVSLGVASADAIEVPVGDGVSVSNGTECAPNVRAAIFLDSGDTDPVPLGGATTDSDGHFETLVTLPDGIADGPARIVVECGIDDSVLVYEVVLVGSSRPFPWFLSDGRFLVVFGSLCAALVAVLAAVLVRRRRARRIDGSGDFDVEGLKMSEAPIGDEFSWFAGSDASKSDPDAARALEGAEKASPGFLRGVLPLQPDDDGADYWLWDVETRAGPARRLACLTETTFHLAEAPERDFPALIQRMSEDGPASALAESFMALSLDRIEEVLRRGDKIRIVYLDGYGSRTEKTVDLGDQVDAVAGMLAERFTIVEVPVRVI